MHSFYLDILIDWIVLKRFYLYRVPSNVNYFLKIYVWYLVVNLMPNTFYASERFYFKQFRVYLGVMITLHSPKLQHYWRFTIRLFRVISRTHVWGVLLFCRRYSRCILQLQPTEPVWAIDKLRSTTTLDQKGPENNVNEGITNTSR